MSADIYCESKSIVTCQYLSDEGVWQSCIIQWRNYLAMFGRLAKRAPERRNRAIPIPESPVRAKFF
jgi:hypothetical protein